MPSVTLKDYYWYMGPFIYTGFLLCLVLHLGIITDTWGRSYTQGFCYAWFHTWGSFLIHGGVHMHTASLMPSLTLGCFTDTWAIHKHRPSVMHGVILGNYYWYMGPFIYTGLLLCLVSHLEVITQTWGRSCAEGFCYARFHTWVL